MSSFLRLSSSRHAAVGLWCLAWLGIVQIGCETRPEPDSSALLDTAKARRSLDAALNAWMHGAGTGQVPGIVPPTHRIDSHSPKDKKLHHYVILGEVSGEGCRWFATQLFFDGAEAPETVRFVVFGENPRFVFRAEDYLMTIHWDHNMSEDDDAAETAKSP
jgi:hypothetical protein